MSRLKKIIAVILTSTLILGMTIAYAVGEIEAQMSGGVAGDKASNRIKVTGYVTYSNLETGFYAVGGYRLVGELNYENLEGKMVEVIGEIDTSPNIYMVKAIKVNSIKIIEENVVIGDPPTIEPPKRNIPTNSENLRNVIEQVRDYREQIERQIMQKQEEIRNITENIDNYISQYGEDSAAVNSYRQERDRVEERLEVLNAELYRVHEREFGNITLQSDLIKLWEDIVAFDGREVPAKIVNERTFVPLRFVSEAFDAQVEWIPEGQVIVVYDAENKALETQILR